MFEKSRTRGMKECIILRAYLFFLRFKNVFEKNNFF